MNQKIVELKPYGKNAKKHPKQQVELIAASIKRFGFDSPIIVDKNNEIIAGHGRLEAAKLLGLEEVPTIKKESLTPAEVKAYRLADNKIAESEWDIGLALEDLKELDEELLSLTGFSQDLLVEPDEKDDVVPENAPTIAQEGDIWQLGQHRVMCGDSTSLEAVQRLMEGKKADMVFTDPPYGVDYSGGIQFTKQGVKKEQRERLIADSTADIYSLVVPILASICNGPIYIWFSDTQALPVYQAVEAVGDIHALLIWKKNGGYAAMNSNYKQKHEPCLYWKAKGNKLNFVGATTETTIWEIDKDGINKLHPTQKPVALSVKAILNHSAGLIVDLFLGSGSTIIGCEKTNRICYGMELDPKYVDVIIKRWEDYTGQKAVKVS